MIGIQFQRLLHSTNFYLSLGIASLLAITQYIVAAVPLLDGMDSSTIIPPSAYLLWLNSSISEITNLFLLILPILAIVPFSMQLLVDKKSKYYQLMMMRSGKFNYLFSMVAVSSLAGFIVIAIPLLLNFFLFSLTFMAIPPNPIIHYVDGIYGFKTLFFSLQLNHPLLHILLYIFLSGVVGSLYACLATTFALFFNFSLIVLVIPMIFHLIVHVVNEPINVAISPINFLNISSRVPVHLWSVSLFCVFVLLCIIILFVIGGKKLDGK